MVAGIEVIPVAALARPGASPALEGVEHGGLGVSLILVDVAPGRGPSLHRHEHHEIFVVQEATATFTDGQEQREVGRGAIVVVRAAHPHAFTNTGAGRLRQVAIHVSDAFETTWL